MQVFLFMVGLIFFTLTLFLFPETMHPGASGVEKAGTRLGFVLLNPFKSLTLIRSPVILCVVSKYVVQVTIWCKSDGDFR